MDIIKREPAIVVGAVTSALALLVAFGVGINETQVDAIVSLVAALLPLVAALVTRSQVYAKSTVVVAEDRDGTLVSGPADTETPDGHPVEVFEVGTVSDFDDSNVNDGPTLGFAAVIT